VTTLNGKGARDAALFQRLESRRICNEPHAGAGGR